jgi:FkbM family methyltransferase
MSKTLKGWLIWFGWRGYEARIAVSLLFNHRIFSSIFLRITKQNACIEESDGNLVIKSKSIFGPAKKSIWIPKDKVIFAQFLKGGYWSLPTSHFICRQFKKMNEPLVLDLGAHVGLVSLQSIKMNFDEGKVIAVEALPNHFAALTSNIDSSKLTAFCGALVSNSSTPNIKMTVDTVNFGNSSALEEIVPKDYARSYQIVVPVVTKNQIIEALNGSSFILKSDLQGYDAGVLAGFGDDFWRLCLAGTIEVNAHKEINNVDIERLLGRFKNYRHVSWQPFSLGRVSDHEILEFWTAGNKLERDIYFW